MNGTSTGGLFGSERYCAVTIEHCCEQAIQGKVLAKCSYSFQVLITTSGYREAEQSHDPWTAPSTKTRNGEGER